MEQNGKGFKINVFRSRFEIDDEGNVRARSVKFGRHRITMVDHSKNVSKMQILKQ